jgi:hypothetical protein
LWLREAFYHFDNHPDHADGLTKVTKLTKPFPSTVRHTLLAVLSVLSGVFAKVLNKHRPF